MRERDIMTRLDVAYPYDRRAEDGSILERFDRPPMFDVKFVYVKKGKSASFKIFAYRL